MGTEKYKIQWRRLLSEGLMIVISILMAFSVDAWWSNRQDREKEKSYLRSIESDLQSTLNNLSRFGTPADSVDWAGTALVRAYYEPKPPSSDSIALWFSQVNTMFEVQPTFATAQFLVSSGDLRLIRDDSLKREIATHVNAINTFVGFLEYASKSFKEASQELRTFIEIDLIQLKVLDPQVRALRSETIDQYPFPAGELRPIELPNLTNLIFDKEVHEILFRMNGDKRSYSTNRRRIQRNSEDMLKIVQSALNK